MKIIDIQSNDWGNLESPWISVPIDLWSSLIAGRPKARYRSGQDIYWQAKQHSNVYIIAKGRVCVSILHRDGQQKHLFIGCIGAMLGEISCILSRPHTTTATAITETEVYCIPSKEVQMFFHSEARLADWLLQYEAYKNRILMSQISMLSFEKASQRIARLFLCISENYGKKRPDGIFLNLRFTCAELASIANVSRVTANNTVLTFIHDGILAKEKSRYIIRDVGRLKEIADRIDET